MCFRAGELRLVLFIKSSYKAVSFLEGIIESSIRWFQLSSLWMKSYGVTL